MMEFFEPADIMIYIQGRGMVLKEKSFLAFDIISKKIVAYGDEAGHMVGHQAENIHIISPLRTGVIADYVATVQLFRHLLIKAWGKKLLLKVPMAICVPKGLTEVEKKAVEDVMYQIGAKEVFIADIPIERLLKELPADKNWQKIKIFIGITKDEPKRYITEQYLNMLNYAKQEGISIEEVKDLLNDSEELNF